MSFIIEINYPLEGTSISITLQAIVEPKQSAYYYCAHSFISPLVSSLGKDNSLLPPQNIRCIEKGDMRHWVPIDSEKETSLSVALGEAIEKTLFQKGALPFCSGGRTSG